MKNLFTAVGGILILGVVLILGGKATKVAPQNAQVILDDSFKVYHAPSHQVVDNLLEKKISTIKQAEEMGYKRDDGCKHYFETEEFSSVWALLDSAGVVKAPTRWSENGTWKY